VAFPPAFPFLVLPLYFRYQTLRYQFTDDGISMRWGILFRREVIVNYARIQDIHLRSNVVERWLGLARILVQTASGSRAAEMTIEGVREFEALRDFLYAKTRGVKDHPAPAAGPPVEAAGAVGDAADLASVLREVAQELRGVRSRLEQRGAADAGRTHDV
jgi:putative membrane protein